LPGSIATLAATAVTIDPGECPVSASADIAPSSSTSVDETTKPSFVEQQLPFIIATGGEFIGLYFWLAYWMAGNYLLATVTLFIGFLVERITVLGWVGSFQKQMMEKYPNQPPAAATDFKNKPKGQQLAHLAVICLTEISIWVVAAFVFDRAGWVAALAVLILGEQLQHSWELGLMAHRPIRDYIPTWNALKITLLETIGGVAWLWLAHREQPQLGGLFLLVGLSIEHVVQAAKIRVDLEDVFKVRHTARIAKGLRPGEIDPDPSPGENA